MDEGFVREEIGLSSPEDERHPRDPAMERRSPAAASPQIGREASGRPYQAQRARRVGIS